MAGVDQLVLNHALCFLFSRIHKNDTRQLKTVLINFYSSDEISTAKDVLLDCTKGLQNGSKVSRIPRRRDSDNRAARELDDIFSLIAELDANKTLEDLPKFVSDSPDKMPSVNIVEGDLNAFMKRFDKLDSQLNRLEASVNHPGVPAAISLVPTGRGVVNITDAMNECSTAALAETRSTNVNNSVNNQSAVAADAASAPTFNWSANNVSSVETGSCAETSDADDRHWHQVRRRKRRRVPSNIQTNEPNNHTASETAQSKATPAVSYASAASKPLSNQQAKHKQKLNTIVVGRKPPSNDIGCISRISAAKPYTGKATFCVDNVSVHSTVESMRSYVTSMNIDVIGCYQVNPRRSYWQRLHDIYPTDRKTYRVCIPKEDVTHFLDPQIWPAHISVSQWRFKKERIDTHEQYTAAPATSNQQSSLSSVQLANASTQNPPSNNLRSDEPAAGPGSSAGTRQSTPNQTAVLSMATEPADMDATIIVVDHGDAV